MRAVRNPLVAWVVVGIPQAYGAIRRWSRRSVSSGRVGASASALVIREDFSGRRRLHAPPTLLFGSSERIQRRSMPPLVPDSPLPASIPEPTFEQTVPLPLGTTAVVYCERQFG